MTNKFAIVMPTVHIKKKQIISALYLSHSTVSVSDGNRK